MTHVLDSRGNIGAGTGGPGSIAPQVGHRWSRKVASDIVVLLDVVAIVAAQVVTTMLFDEVPFGAGGTLEMMVQMGLAVAILAIALFREGNLYDTANMSSFPLGLIRVPMLLALLFICLVAVGGSFKVISLSPAMWFPTWCGLAMLWVLSFRFACRVFLRSRARRGYFNANVAVFGSGSIAERLQAYLATQNSDISFLGFFDDRPRDRREDGASIVAQGSLEDLIAAGRSDMVDEIIIALPPSAAARISEVARKLEQLPVGIHVCTHIASDLINVNARSHVVSSIGPIGMIDIKRKPFADWGAHLKWLTDKVLGAVFLLGALPVMALIAIAIKLDDGGEILFRQNRRGLNRRPITVLKFRTMSVAENGTDVRQATKGDLRVTRVGRFLRMTSFDELPQLFNVLRGDMSLVGPRPHALVHDDYWGEMLEMYANRQQVKPGITGWAQVNGLRGETGATDNRMRSRIEHDLYYIDNWSIWLDFKIIAATPFFGLVHKNAY